MQGWTFLSIALYDGYCWEPWAWCVWDQTTLEEGNELSVKESTEGSNQE